MLARARSYVKYIEAAGARVVPIHYNSTQSQLAYLLSRLNGVLFTGGGTDLSPGSKFYATGRQIYDTAASINANGDYFPLWGTCSKQQLIVLPSFCCSRWLVLRAWQWASSSCRSSLPPTCRCSARATTLRTIPYARSC